MKFLNYTKICAHNGIEKNIIIDNITIGIYFNHHPVVK